MISACFSVSAIFLDGGKKLKHHFNPYLTNGISHHYQLGESTFIFRGVRGDFQFLFNFSIKILQANRIAPDGTPRSAASHLGLCCLPMSHRREAFYDLMLCKTVLGT